MLARLNTQFTCLSFDGAFLLLPICGETRRNWITVKMVNIANLWRYVHAIGFLFIEVKRFHWLSPSHELTRCKTEKTSVSFFSFFFSLCLGHPNWAHSFSDPPPLTAFHLTPPPPGLFSQVQWWENRQGNPFAEICHNLQLRFMIGLSRVLPFHCSTVTVSSDMTTV